MTPKFRVIDSYEDHDKAQELLLSLYDELKYIIDERKWNIRVLREYYRKDEYGVNQSNDIDSDIYLCLRTHSDPTKFYSFEELLETLIHEIAHCKISKHGKEFNKLVDELTEQYTNTKWLIKCPIGLSLREVAENNCAERHNILCYNKCRVK